MLPAIESARQAKRGGVVGGVTTSHMVTNGVSSGRVGVVATSS